ncbi:hypothetical protein L227DRAFT_615886 [Lentinus tigrinus ALCF2SS1-6]|uniref:Uncharacterized protein n=1 Tax=Lentinus tigrinus ALCF2SS1-6 TaxID=1328759 RepID=A0A5C2RU42_9APHY|nr:hypothetical protein L227DRAFT_615886 [Lentinus tigrinus ALCF2SS1-6]
MRLDGRADRLHAGPTRKAVSDSAKARSPNVELPKEEEPDSDGSCNKPSSQRCNHCLNSSKVHITPSSPSPFSFWEILSPKGSSLVLPARRCAFTYWFTTFDSDVFETGKNLPSHIGDPNLNLTEDEYMAVVWSRTLVCLVDEKVPYNMKMATAELQVSSPSQRANTATTPLAPHLLTLPRHS